MTQQEVLCKECGLVLDIPNDTIIGEVISCKDCGSDWEIVSPQFNIKKAEVVGEDWGQ